MAFYPPSVIIPVYASFTAVGTILLGLRLWVRVVLSPFGLGTDDILSIASILFVYGCTGVQLWNATSGTGGNFENHEYQLRALVIARKVDASQALLEILAVGTIKLSLLYFYRRIFGVIPSFYRHSLICIWLTAIWMLGFLIGHLALCRTRMYYMWAEDANITESYCGSKGLILLVFGITSMITDLIVLGLPLVYLRKVRMPKQKKWPAAMVILLGTVSTFACLLRVIFLCIAYPLGTIEWNYQPDSTAEIPLAMQMFNPSFWIMVEMWLGLWASNLLPTGPLYLSICGARKRRIARKRAPGGEFSRAYEMGSRRDKMHGVSAVEELETTSDAAPSMGPGDRKSVTSIYMRGG